MNENEVPPVIPVERIVYVERPAKKDSVASGVFWGLFCFFIVLPAAIIAFLVLIGMLASH